MNGPRSLLAWLVACAAGLHGSFQAAEPARAQARAGAGAADTIVLVTGQRLRNCEVLRDGFEQVAFRQGGTERTVAGSQVERVEWGNPPEALVRGELAQERRDFETAANHFAEAAQGTGREPVKAYATFRAARCLLLGSQADPSRALQAAESLQAFLEAHGTSRFAPQARIAHGQALRLAGRPEEAVAAFRGVEEATLAGNWGAAWDGRAKYQRALAHLDASQYDEARLAFQGAATALRALAGGDAPVSAEVRSLAVAAAVGQGESFIAADRYREAANYFEELAGRAGTDVALQAAATGGRAQAAYYEGRKAGDEKVLRQAQLWAAQVIATDILDGDSTAKALYYYGRIVLALGKDLEGEDPVRRANDYFNRVARLHTGTRWAARAQAQLAGGEGG